MSSSTLIIFNALAKSLPASKRTDLIRFLSEGERDFLKTTPFSSNKLDVKDFQTKAFLSQIHYSWIYKAIIDQKEKKLFLAILDNETKKEISSLLKTPVPTAKLNKHVTQFLKQKLIALILAEKKDLLPAKYLPLSPLTDLLTLTKKNLVTLIDFLSLYDLSYELKHIVNTKLIKQIFNLLTEWEKDFLKTIMNIKEPFTFPRINLEKWDGLEQSLRSLLHKRGIKRLSIALVKEHPDFNWHICHRLDSGRGQMLLKLKEEKIDVSIIQAIQANIVEIIPTIRS